MGRSLMLLQKSGGSFKHPGLSWQLSSHTARDCGRQPTNHDILGGGAASWAQHFGDGLRLNIYFCAVVSNGAFKIREETPPLFAAVPAPTPRHLGTGAIRVFRGIYRPLADLDPQSATEPPIWPRTLPWRPAYPPPAKTRSHCPWQPRSWTGNGFLSCGFQNEQHTTNSGPPGALRRFGGAAEAPHMQNLQRQIT